MEMIATVSILGIVSVVALPVISNVSDSFTQKKFEAYGESLLAAGKLFADQNGEDLFGSADNGCVDVAYDAIEEKNLIQDIELDNASCASPSTFVRVTKVNGSYQFDLSIECAINNEIVYQKVMDSKDECVMEGKFDGGMGNTLGKDDGDDDLDFWTPYGKDKPRPTGYFATPATIYSDPHEGTEPVKKQTVTILVSNDRGFAPNVKIRYYWVNADTNAVVGDKKDKDFKNALIKTSTTFRQDVTTPTISANLKLVVEPINVINADGLQITNRYESGIFPIDNTAPNIVIKASSYENDKVGSLIKQVNNANLSITDWKKHGYYFDFSASSDNYGITKQVWKWNSSGNATLDNKLTGGPTENNGVTNKTFTGLGARYGTIQMCDNAGNCASKTIQVNISTTYTIQYDANGGSGNTSSTTCYYGYDCTLSDPGFTRVNYKFEGWNIDGTEYSKNAVVKNLTTKNGDTKTAKARWKLNTYKITLKGNGVDDPADVEKIHGTDLTLPTPSRSGYTFIGWNTDSNSHDKGYGTTFKENNDKTLYAIWKKTSAYTINYKMDKGTWHNDYSDSESCYIWNQESSCSIKIDDIPRPSGHSSTDNGDASTANGRSYNYDYKNLFNYVGWNKNSGQTTADYNQGDTINLTSSIDMYAVILLDRDGKRFRVSNTSDNTNHSGLTMKNAVGGTKVYVMHDGAIFIASGRLSWGYLDGHVWIHGHMANEGCTINTLDWPEKGKTNHVGRTWGYTLHSGRGWYGSCACYKGPDADWNITGSGDCYSNNNWSTAKYLYPI